VLDSFELGVDAVRLVGFCANLVKRRHDQLGATYLIATQSMEGRTPSWADEIVVLWEGRVIEQGPARQVLGLAAKPKVRQPGHRVNGRPASGWAGERRRESQAPPPVSSPADGPGALKVPGAAGGASHC